MAFTISNLQLYNNADRQTKQITITKKNQIGVLFIHTSDGRDKAFGIATFNGVNGTRPAGLPQSNSTGTSESIDLVYWNLSDLASGTYNMFYEVTTGDPDNGGFGFFIIEGVDPITPISASNGFCKPPSGSSMSITLNNARPGCLIFDYGFVEYSATYGAGQTEIFKRSGSYYGQAFASYKVLTTAGNATISENESGNFSYFAMSVNPEPIVGGSFLFNLI